MLLESGVRGKERRPETRCVFGWILAISLVFTHAAVAEKAAEKTAKKPVILSTGNRLGQLGPCGCTLDPKGSLARLVEWSGHLSERGLENTVWIDSGNNLFPLEDINPGLEDNWKKTALLLADAYRALKIRAMAPGPKDFAAGLHFLSTWFSKSKIDAVAANLSHPDSKRIFWKPFVEWKIGSEKWAVTSVLPVRSVTRDGVAIEEPVPALERVMKQIRAKGIDSIVVLSTLDRAANLRIASELHPKMIVGSSDDLMDAPENVAGTTLWTHRREAQSVLVFDPRESGSATEEGLTDRWDPVSVKAISWRNKVSALNTERRNAAVDKTKVVPPKKRVPHPYVANQYLCKNCHKEQYDFWEKTKHASAYLVLFAKNQHFDPECIGCHSAGYGEKAGFTSIADPLLLKGAPPRKGGEKPILETVLEEAFVGENPVQPLDSRIEPARYATLKSRFHAAMDKRAADPGWEKIYAGVQCENCHGNRDEHVYGDKAKTLANRKPVTSATCVKCHNAERDPNFSFQSKIAQVSCPRIAK